MAAKNPKHQTFEESLKRLEDIVNKLEQGEVPLEDSIKMYEEGLALSTMCLEKLTHAELKLKKLSKNVDGTLHLLDEETDR